MSRTLGILRARGVVATGRLRALATLATLGALYVLSALSGCAGSLPSPDGWKVDVVKVWPEPPDSPRIRYEGALRGVGDLVTSPSVLTRALAALAGGRIEPKLTLNRPTDVFAFGNRVYVTDGGASQLLAFDLALGTAQVVGDAGPGRLSRPFGLDGDSRGNVYVTDPPSRRVAEFDSTGQFLRAFGSRDVLLNPIDVALEESTGRIYVVDSHLHQVVVFDSAGVVVGRLGRHLGNLAAKNERMEQTELEPGAADAGLSAHGSGSRDLIENRGGGDGEFLFPVSISIDADGFAYVTDGINCRVQAFDKDLAFVRQVGRMGDTPGSFARPKGVAADRHGHVYVVDAAFNNVQIFDREGRLLLTFGDMGHGAGQMWLPLGIHVDQHDRIYVADRYNGRLQIFQYLDEPTSTQNVGPRLGE